MRDDDAPLPGVPEAVFDCVMCGVCCEGRGGIVVSDRDLERLCRHLALGPEAFEREWGERRGGKLHIRAGEDGYCVFFVEGRGCRVHVAKPDVCRAWPFFRGNLLDEESFALAKADCPGISRRCGHEDFAREGLGYLLREGIAGGGGEDEAAALRLDDLLEKFGFPHK